jgi:hypothetical protein
MLNVMGDDSDQVRSGDIGSNQNAMIVAVGQADHLLRVSEITSFAILGFAKKLDVGHVDSKLFAGHRRQPAGGIEHPEIGMGVSIPWNGGIGDGLAGLFKTLLE